MYSATRNDLKKMAADIETLAKELQSKLDTGDAYMLISNELVRHTTTMTFTLGEVYALEQTSKTQKPSSKNASYYNVRGPSGRFVKR